MCQQNHLHLGLIYLNRGHQCRLESCTCKLDAYSYYHAAPLKTEFIILGPYLNHLHLVSDQSWALASQCRLLVAYKIIERVKYIQDWQATSYRKRADKHTLSGEPGKDTTSSSSMTMGHEELTPSIEICTDLTLPKP